jgi:broad specificity phosphatase PhoE
MRTLEIRRHSKRDRPGKHLSRDGVALAREVGRSMGPFDRVVTSSAWRCVETAVAMGFAVDETRDDLHMHRADDLPDKAMNAKTFADLADTLDGGNVRKLAEDLAKIWQEIAKSLKPNGRGLVICHGVLTELGALASLPDADPEKWGKTLDVCEGLRFTYDRGASTTCQIIRLDKTVKVSRAKRPK